MLLAFLGLLTATVSRRLSKAESDAGHIFFERMPAGLRLTRIGEAVLDHANRIEPELFLLERYLMGQEEGIKGPLRVTIPPLMMTNDVSKDITDFANKYPEIQLEFVGDNNLVNLHQREADVAIRVTHKPPETLWGRKLTEQHAAYYAAKDLIDISELERGNLSGDLPLISFTSWRNQIPKQIKNICPNVRVVATSDDMITAMQMVRAGLGVTKMPRIIGENLEGVRRVSVLPWERYIPIWLLTHPDLRKVPRVMAFMSFIAERIGERRSQYQIPE